MISCFVPPRALGYCSVTKIGMSKALAPATYTARTNTFLRTAPTDCASAARHCIILNAQSSTILRQVSTTTSKPVIKDVNRSCTSQTSRAHCSGSIFPVCIFDILGRCTLRFPVSLMCMDPCNSHGWFMHVQIS